MARHNELGREGEKLAVDYLTENGYEILEQNYRVNKSEIDIIVKKDDIVAFVEVKTRTTNAFGTPEEFVDDKKKNHIIKVANFYVIANDIESKIRFDIIAIVMGKTPKIQHFEDAYYYF
ncbi:YraN family protein [Capnocytophaga sp. ARDL2]|uniref:YraN family protein n=1 Tax=Capnocytophaga sp. ARDL2 TaxID=3238809 RepID=UPI003558870E